MTNLVLTMINGEPTVTSRQVAEDFGKELSKIHRSIEAIHDSTEGKDVADFGVMFQCDSYTDSYGRTQNGYSMNRDGWTLLAMGFTGAKAIQWKLRYIKAFNDMEAQLAQNPMNLPTTYSDAIRLLADTWEAKDALTAKVAELEPKAKAFDVFLDSKGYYSVGTAAKMVGMGRNGLLGLLRGVGIFMENNVPYQYYLGNK